MSETIYQSQPFTSRQLKYQLHYDKLILRGQLRATNRTDANLILNGYCEEHHIIPLCLGGQDTSNNKVFLSPEEHFVAHQLLSMIYPSHQGITFAISLMSVDEHNRRINNKQFGWIKRRISVMRTGLTKENCEWMARSAQNRTGHRKETHPYLQKRSDDYRILTDQQQDEIVRMRDELKYEFKQIHKEFILNEIQISYTAIVGNYNKRKIQFDKNFSSSVYGSRKLTNEQCFKIVDMIDNTNLSINEIYNILIDSGVDIALTTIYGTYHLTKRQLDPNYSNISLKRKKIHENDLKQLKIKFQETKSYTESWNWLLSLGYTISYNKVYGLLRNGK